MLLLEAEVYFDLHVDNSQALTEDLDTKYIIRPSINFGNDILLSGNIIGNYNVTKFIRGQYHKVIIEMPAVDSDVYNEISGLIKIRNSYLIQIASRVIGKAKILDLIFE
ncbi:hypothetical protein [Clostridium sp. C8-1-8]|uniref:hypothetical protein n=1 Tax=Clostridium sp. C8-1-8 TaxID=2698831 RepID=UPI00136EB656|nr:hypothetical protein [Clostridium sp. C8-1-8]